MVELQLICVKVARCDHPSRDREEVKPEVKERDSRFRHLDEPTAGLAERLCFLTPAPSAGPCSHVSASPVFCKTRAYEPQIAQACWD